VAEAGKSASEVSRRDEHWTGPAGVLSIGGGKLTAYRRMAERVTDDVEKALGRKPSPCRTARESLPGGDADPETVRAELESTGLTPLQAQRLVGLYGGGALDLSGGPAAEAAHAVTHEGALTLEDYWVRRGARAWFDADGGVDALEPAATAMAPLLGWNEARRDAEIAACHARRQADLAEVTG